MLKQKDDNVEMKDEYDRKNEQEVEEKKEHLQALLKKIE